MRKRIPRDGSVELPGGKVPLEPMNVGELAKPPFAVLPDPARLFARRAERFAALAPGHQIEGYLRFLAEVARAQASIQKHLPPPTLPAAEHIAKLIANGMPPLAVGALTQDDIAARTFARLVAALQEVEQPQATRDVLARVAAATDAERVGLMSAVLLDDIPEDRVAEHVLAAAAVQVHMARLAAGLDVEALQRVTDGACPACGGGPVASALVNWEGAHGTRFCTCATCATQWNVPRIRCLACGEEKGVAYHTLDGGDGLIAGETCDSCKAYVKIVYLTKDAALEPLADDVASLALDLTLGREGWLRAAANPFLMGY